MNHKPQITIIQHKLLEVISKGLNIDQANLYYNIFTYMYLDNFHKFLIYKNLCYIS